MSREAIDRAALAALTFERDEATPTERVRAALQWIMEVTPLVPEEVMRPMAITILRDCTSPLKDSEGKPMILKLMNLMLRKCGCMHEERLIADELEACVTEIIERRREFDGEDWKDV